MKKINLGPFFFILCFLLAFWGYRRYDALHTDTDLPTITIDDTQLLQVSVQDPKIALLQGVTAQDKQDGALTEKLVVEYMQLVNRNGLIEVGYAVADNAGNVAKATREVKYTDYKSPKFSLDAPLVYEEHDQFDIMSAVGAYDVLDGDIQHRIRATSLDEEDISKLGKHQVYFQVTNSLGDTVNLVMPVEVLEPDTYDADLTLTDYLIYLPVGISFQPDTYLESFTHRGEEFSLINGLPRDFSLKTSGTVDTGTPGVYTVEYKVTYTIRNDLNRDYDQKFVGHSKLIVVVEG